MSELGTFSELSNIIISNAFLVVREMRRKFAAESPFYILFVIFSPNFCGYKLNVKVPVAFYRNPWIREPLETIYNEVMQLEKLTSTPLMGSYRGNFLKGPVLNLSGPILLMSF